MAYPPLPPPPPAPEWRAPAAGRFQAPPLPAAASAQSPPPRTPSPGVGPSAPIATPAVLALVFGFLFAPLGIVLGHIGLSRVKRTGERGRGLAIAGLVLGYVGLVGGVIAIAVTAVGLAQLGSAPTASIPYEADEGGSTGIGSATDGVAEAPSEDEGTTANEEPVPAAPQLSRVAQEYCPAGDSIAFEGESTSFEVVVCAGTSGYTYAGGNAEFGYIAVPAVARNGGWVAANSAVEYSVSDPVLRAVDRQTGEAIVAEPMLWSTRFE